ncbi:MAG: hypothetical protein JXM73_14360 [Anaerolineae bacterium]|nr:hypothetical protein [Anaerolineae bacterium]
MSVTLQYDHLVRRAINDELLRQANLYRATHPREMTNRRANRVVCCTLSWVGRRLVAWGQRLRERYEPVLQRPVPQVN